MTVLGSLSRTAALGCINPERDAAPRGVTIVSPESRSPGRSCASIATKSGPVTRRALLVQAASARTGHVRSLRAASRIHPAPSRSFSP